MTLISVLTIVCYALIKGEGSPGFTSRKMGDREGHDGHLAEKPKLKKYYSQPELSQ